jgi:hypothetical protein
VSFLLRVAAVCGPKGVGAPDTDAPTLTSATIAVNGNSISLLFSEPVVFGAGSNGGFVVTMSGGASVMTYSSGSGSSTLVYTLGRQITTGETCSNFAYTQPGNGVEDGSGNDLVTFNNQQAKVTNNADTTAPTLSSVTDVKTGQTTATIGVDTNEGNGTLYWAVSTNTTRSIAQIKAGTGCAQFSSVAVSSTGTKTVNVTGLTANTTYYAHFTQTDAANNDATAVNGDGFTTDSAGGGGDVTAPVLSSPVDTVTGSTTASLSVTTDEGNGTLYWVVSTSSSAPSAAQVKAGQMHTGAAAAASGNQAVSGTGAQSVSGGATGLTAATAYYAHFMHEDSSANQSSVSSGDGLTTYTSEAQALFTAMSSEPDATRKGVINTCIAALKTAGVWTKCDRIYVFAAHDAQAARLDWKTPGTDTLTVSGAPVFTTDQGYQGDAVSGYLYGATNFSAFTQFTQNSAHISVWNRSDVTSTKSLFGTLTLATTVANPKTGVPGFIYRVNQNSGTEHTGLAGYTGHMLAVRTGASATTAYRNGSSVGTGSVASVAPSADPLGVFRAANTQFNGEQQAALISIGAALNATEASDFYTAVQTYMTAVGA